MYGLCFDMSHELPPLNSSYFSMLSPQLYSSINDQSPFLRIYLINGSKTIINTSFAINYQHQLKKCFIDHWLFMLFKQFFQAQLQFFQKMYHLHDSTLLQRFILINRLLLNQIDISSYKYSHLQRHLYHEVRKCGIQKMQERQQERKKLKKSILHQMKALRAPPKSTPQVQIECLVKQADFYANFLLSRVEKQKSEEDFDESTFTRLTEQPSILKGGQLKYYQLVALNWMISLYESGISGILADDMGLGKTIQSISMLAFLKEYKSIDGPHIIIAPKITLGNWMRQLQKWLPSSRSIKLQATKEEREQGLSIVNSGEFDIVVTSYEGVRLCVNALKKISWQYIIIDEAHKIKNQDSQLSQIVRKLSTECKLLLTGTPLQNNLHQLWSLMNFLIPEVFSSAEPFDNWSNANEQDISAEEKEKQNIQMISQLHKILRPFMLRRTKAEVQKTLPGKKQILIYVGLSQVQLKIYKNLLQNRSASQQQKKYYLNLLMQLRKVCCHPYLFPNVEPSDAPPVGEHLIIASEKLRILDKLLNKLYKQGGHKVLIFSQMTTILDILEDYCHLRMYKYCRIDGSTDMKSRDSQIEAFMNTDEHFIFLLSTRAGGLGINLTSADTVVIYDSDFNPQMDLQAMDRAHRIGQKKEVRVYRLITQDTVQQKIIERQMIKLKWDSLVIQQQRSAQKNKTLTKDEMKEMLQFGANAIFKATNNTITDEFIDDLLYRGEQKTNKLHQQMSEQLKAPQDLVNLNVDNINIFDFMQRDEEQRRKDKEALDQYNLKELQLQSINQFRGRREKIKQPRIKIQKKIIVSQHHFYHNKERLRQLLQKEEDYKNNKNMEECPPLTQQEEKQKNQLLQTGHRDWNKSDFISFISANEKLGRSNYGQIAQTLGKSLETVIIYSQTFWQRYNELTQYQKILKQIQSGEERIENKKQQHELLEWKAGRCLCMDFSSTFYAKFKSKLFSIEADRYMAEKVLQLGTRNITKLKQSIRQESMFRFDHYLRTRNETELNKRMSSIYKLIEKEKDNQIFEMDRQKPRKKRQKNWDEEVAAEQSKAKKKRK